MNDRTARRRPGLVLAMLLLVYSFNFLDRQILGVLAAPIQADLHLDDAQFGKVGGLAFALLYATLGVPLAMLADRTSRSGVIAGALVAWSGFTALCGLATGFWSLFWCRLGVGVGEAGGAAPAYALIADTFPPERRARALGIYSLGVPIGIAAGSLLGGWVAQAVDWRAAFVVVGLAGIAVAPAFRWLVRDPPRAASAPAPVSLRELWRRLSPQPAFWLLSLAAASSSLVGYGLALWTPSVLVRSYGFTKLGTGQFVGSLALVGGSAGVVAGGLLADRLGRGDRRWYARLPAIAWVATVPFFAAGILSRSPAFAWALLLVPNALAILWLGPIVTAVQHLVPARLRASAGGCFLLVNNLIGLGAGPWLMGSLSKALTASHGADALRTAAVWCLGFYLLAAALALLAARPLARAWVAE